MALKVTITGGAGFIGSNVADHLASNGAEVTLFDNLSRSGTERNLAWLLSRHGDNLRVVRGDVRDYTALAAAVAGADVVYHLAGQVAVTTSVYDPRSDFEVNALGTFNALEAARHAGSDPIVLFTSTNKVYGGMEDVVVEDRGHCYAYRDFPQGIPEARPLDFHSPYGCSKGAGDQYVRDYHRIYGLRTVVFRMSCIYGPRQFGNEDQGWVAHFIIQSFLGKPLTIYGDGKQVRDILFVQDLVAAFDCARSNIDRAAGNVYNIGGGSGNTISLLQLIAKLEESLGQRVDVSFDEWRPGDQKVYVSDIAKAEAELGWRPRVSRDGGVTRLTAWVRANKSLFEVLTQ